MGPRGSAIDGVETAPVVSLVAVVGNDDAPPADGHGGMALTRHRLTPEELLRRQSAGHFGREAIAVRSAPPGPLRPAPGRLPHVQGFRGLPRRWPSLGFRLRQRLSLRTARRDHREHVQCGQPYGSGAVVGLHFRIVNGLLRSAHFAEVATVTCPWCRAYRIPRGITYSTLSAALPLSKLPSEAHPVGG